MTYTRTVQLPVDLDEAFALITEPERLRRWQAVSAQVDLRVGGEYRWTVTPGHAVAGTYREVDPGKRVVFTWGWDGASEPAAEDPSTVTITLAPVDGGTSVTLVHEGLAPEQEAGHAEGWNHFLERLEKAATEGDAGPDEWAASPENLDPVVSAEAALAVLQGVVRNLTEEDRAERTPCAEYDCHELAEHLLGSIVGLGSMAGGEIVDPDAGSLENRVAVMADQAIAAWRTRGLEGSVPGPGGRDFPAAMACSILSIELLLHGWDLAQASGQDLPVSDELAAYVLTLAETIVPGGRGSSFADEVEAPADASPLERLVAFSGRRPLVTV